MASLINNKNKNKTDMRKEFLKEKRILKISK